jgi:hypothetical protein
VSGIRVPTIKTLSNPTLAVLSYTHDPNLNLGGELIPSLLSRFVRSFYIVLASGGRSAVAVSYTV